MKVLNVLLNCIFGIMAFLVLTSAIVFLFFWDVESKPILLAAVMPEKYINDPRVRDIRKGETRVIRKDNLVVYLFDNSTYVSEEARLDYGSTSFDKIKIGRDERGFLFIVIPKDASVKFNRQKVYYGLERIVRIVEE